MTNLKPCPCGKTPEKLAIYDSEAYRYSRAYGTCCSEWEIEFRGDDNPLDDVRTYNLAVEAWNAAPRAVPIPCPNECDHGRVPDVDAMTTEQFLAALQDGDEVPTIPCPTCAPFGGRGAIMVESEEAGDA